MTVPHLRTIKERQPEARLTLIAKPQFKELNELFPFVDKFVALPHGTMRRFRQLRAMGRSAKPECHVLFTNSMRGDLESWLVGAENRLGMAYPGRHRPLLTGVYRLDSFRHEQAYLSSEIRKLGILKFWPDEWCPSFKYHCVPSWLKAWFQTPRTPENSSVINFSRERIRMNFFIGQSRYSQ